MSGQPANKATASRTSEKTCSVDESRDASTTDADSADVKDKEEVKLSQPSQPQPGFGDPNLRTDLFSCTSSSWFSALRLPRRRASLRIMRKRRTLASGPVVKFARSK